MKTFPLFCVIAALPLALPLRASETTAEPQNIVIERAMQIPGAILTPGQYTLSVEDRMKGRAIVRIDSTAANGEHHFLLLTVPNSKIETNAGGQIILFPSSDGEKQILRAWSCPGCDVALEIVYPKLEAVQIVANTGQSVMAADPVYDKLPVNLSADDMKVVTLWLLSPERISNQRGVGLQAVKYTSDATSSLPQTASNTGSVGAAGLVFLMTYSILCIQRRRRNRCSA
jgi:LPXTG-motif cell wall-anchored protein